MPKVARTAEEIQAVKKRILSCAVDLMAESGYEDFSMRKLAQPLKIAAKTIYNYYRNKDELYLSILTSGFERLFECCNQPFETFQDPFKRLDAMLVAYMEFGIRESNFYNLMFTWHVPKYNDYIGSEMESAARIELETALRCPELFVKAVKLFPKTKDDLTDERAWLIVIQMWIQLHGYLAGYNNTILGYMHEDPILLKPVILKQIAEFYRGELEKIQS